MIKVWGRRNSLNVQKVMWTLGELDLEYERIDVAGSFGVDENYLAKNPNGVVPTIQDQNLVMYESNACVRYLARSYGFDYLCPADPRLAATADQWMDWQCGTFSAAFFQLFFNRVRRSQENRDDSQMEKGLRQTIQLLKQLESLLTTRDFIVGDSLTMADIAVGAHLYRYYEMEIERPAMPALDAYYSRLTARPAYQYHVMLPFGRNPDEWQEEELKNAGIQ